MGPAAARAAPAKKAKTVLRKCIFVEVSGFGSEQDLCDVRRVMQMEGRALRLL